MGPNVHRTHWVIGWQSRLHSNGRHAEWKMTIMWLSVRARTYLARRLRTCSCRTCLWRWPRSGSRLRLRPPLWWCSSRKSRSDGEMGRYAKNTPNLKKKPHTPGSARACTDMQYVLTSAHSCPRWWTLLLRSLLDYPPILSFWWKQQRWVFYFRMI